MVIGLLAITAIPTVTGVGQAISAQKKQNAAAKEQVKFHMEAMMLDDASGQWKDVASVVLADQKVVPSHLLNPYILYGVPITKM